MPVPPTSPPHPLPPLHLDCPLGPLTSTTYPTPAPPAGSTVTCSIRPETLRLLPPDKDADAEGGLATEASGLPSPPPTTSSTPNINTFAATRADTMYLGETAQHLLSINDHLALKAFELNPRLLPADAEHPTVHVQVDPQDVVILND